MHCPNNYALSHDSFGPTLSFTVTNREQSAVYLINSSERKFKGASAKRHKQNAAELPSRSRRCEGRNAEPGPVRTERAANPGLPGTGRCETRVERGCSAGTGTTAAVSRGSPRGPLAACGGARGARRTRGRRQPPADVALGGAEPAAAGRAVVCAAGRGLSPRLALICLISPSGHVFHPKNKQLRKAKQTEERDRAPSCSHS